MPRVRRPATLAGRLALWYAVILAVILCAYSATVFFVAIVEVEEEEADDAPLTADQEIDKAGERMLIALGVGLPLSLAVAIGGGLWTTRRALQPIDEVIRVAGDRKST